jgi:hypothetical protein
VAVTVNVYGVPLVRLGTTTVFAFPGAFTGGAGGLENTE